MKPLFTAISLASLATFAGCSQEPAPESDPIVIGMVVNRSREAADFSQGLINGAQLAVDEVNSAGGLLDGRPILLDIRNDKGLPEEAERETRDLIAGGAVAVTGFTSSSRALGPAQVAADEKVPVLSCCGTSDQLTEIPESGDGYFFRIVPPDSLQAPVVAEAAVEHLDCTRMVVLHYDDAYGAPFAPLIAEAFEELGGVVAASIPIREESGTFFSAINEAEENSPECLALVAFGEDIARIISEWDEEIGRSVGWIATDGALSGDLIANIDPALLDGLVVTSPDFLPETPRADTVRAAYSQTYGTEAPAFSLGQYDLIAVLALAIEHAGEADPEIVRNSLFTVSAPGDFRVEPGSIHEGLSALSRGADVDYQGATGVVDFDPCGNVTTDYALLMYSETEEDFVRTERISVDEGTPCPRAEN